MHRVLSKLGKHYHFINPVGKMYVHARARTTTPMHLASHFLPELCALHSETSLYIH